MALDFKRVQKPARKLRKLLKKMPRVPDSKQVHDFRTNARQLEATLRAFQLDTDAVGRRVLKSLSRLRKRAGKIRDMDVLTAYASSIRPEDDEQPCLVELLEHLGVQRRKHARKFHSAVRRDGSRLRKRLKRTEQALNRTQAKNEKNGRRAPETSSSAVVLGSELASVPQLNRSNLHPFRLKVKELRNVIRLAQDPDQDLLTALGSVKDAIGEWHDWEELVGMAEEVLDHGTQCGVIREIKARTRDKYDTALSQAEQLRKRYLGLSGKQKLNRSHSAPPAEPVVRAAIRLVA